MIHQIELEITKKIIFYKGDRYPALKNKYYYVTYTGETDDGNLFISFYGNEGFVSIQETVTDALELFFPDIELCEGPQFDENVNRFAEIEKEAAEAIRNK